MNRFRWRGVFSVVVATLVAIGGLSAPAAASGNASSAAASSPCGTAPTGPAVGYAPNNKLVIKQAANGCITLNDGVVYKYRASQFLKVEVISEFGLAHPQILELKSGVSFADVDAQLDLSDNGGTTGANAIQWFTGTRAAPGKPAVPGHAFLRGGLGTSGSPEKPSTVSFERTLSARTYHVAQMRISGDIKPSTTARAFVVEGNTTPMFTPLVQRVTVTNPNPDTEYSDNFSVYNSFGGANSKEIKTNALVTVANSTGGIAPVSQRELHFFQWTEVQPGTTNEMVCASYSGGPNRFVSGGGTQTFGTLSSGNMVHYKITVRAGLYWVTSWIPDGDSGVSHALEHPAGAPDKCEGAIVPVVSQYTPRPSVAQQRYDLAA